MSLQFHSLCVPVKGFLRTAIYDLQFGHFYFSGNHIWEDLKKKNISNDSTVAPNIFLAKPESSILPLDKPEFDYPSSITNAIIEIDMASDFSKLVQELQKVFCYNLQVVISAPGLKEEYIKNMIHIINKSIVKHCELVICFEDFIKTKEFLKRSEFPELAFVSIYNSPENKLKYASREYASILFSKDPFSFKEGVNVKNFDLFRINPMLYAESLQYNNYYNRKVFIDKNGMIRNGPLSESSYGNIYTNHSWKRLLKNKKFKSLWKVKKDLISVCKVCEFRYMCTDARIPAPHEKENKWYHTSECNYNPYIAKWRGEHGYTSLEPCGVIVEQKGISINYNVLSKTLQNIYGQ